MNRARQRAACGLMLLLLSAGCEARSSVEAAQTAVVVVQTAVPVSTTGLQTILAGADVTIETTPPDADNNSVTNVDVHGTDASGALSRLPPPARQAAASAALTAAAQYYPNAAITLTVADASGNTLVSGTKVPGQAPSVQ